MICCEFSDTKMQHFGEYFFTTDFPPPAFGYRARRWEKIIPLPSPRQYFYGVILSISIKERRKYGATRARLLIDSKKECKTENCPAG